MDRYRREFEEMVRGGADPRRAAPWSIRAPMIQVARAPWWMCVSIGFVIPLLAALGIAVSFDLRIAGAGDIRLAALVRSAIPDADAVGSDVVVGRLALPPDAAKVVARLVTTSQPAPGWMTLLSGHVPLSVDPGRVEALREILLRLRPLGNDARSQRLERLEELDRLTREPGASEIIEQVAALAPSVRRALAQDGTLGQALDQFGQTDPLRRATLLGFGISNLPEKPPRLAIVTRIDRLNDDAFSVLRTWLESNDYQRNAAGIWMLGQLVAGDGSAWAVITGLYARDPRLMALVPSLRSYCVAGTRRNCP